MTMPLLSVVALQGLGDQLQYSPVLAAATLFGAGLLTSFTPCIWPMIPITVGLLAGTGAEQAPRRRIVALTLTYALGLALLYAFLGMLAGLTGSLFGTVASSPWARFAIGNILLIFGLAMLDVIPVRVPQRLLRWAQGMRGGSYPAALALGATSGVVAAPCGAPAFAVVLTWVATTQSAVLGFVYLFIFSIGMTAVLIAVGISAGTLAALPQAGRWTAWVKKAAGLIMLGVAEYYFIQMGMVL